jgi:hypothetical protein
VLDDDAKELPASGPMLAKPGTQFQDHPNVVVGRAAMPRPLAKFAACEFATQCPTSTCRFRRFPVGPIVAARLGITVADALARLRCRDNFPLPRLRRSRLR